MSDMQFSDDTREIMEKFISSFPIAIRESYRSKIMKGVEYQLLKKGLNEVTKDICQSLCQSTEFPA